MSDWDLIVGTCDGVDVMTTGWDEQTRTWVMTCADGEG